MEIILTLLAMLTLITLVVTGFEFLIGFHQLKNLHRQSVLTREQLPSISIILSALNEQIDIETALISMLSLDYPKLEVIAVNDRSTDQTPAILNQLAKHYPHLRVHHINELPAGWFGKNHALQVGAELAAGDWLLFTDADVVMKPQTLTKAISYVMEQQLDHLTICEHHLRRTFWLKILLLGHYITYSLAFKPWRIRHAWSKRSLGHGAFNLVNKATYQACGGHAAIAMECLDDLKLGALIKNKGYRQDTVDGRDYVEREWYTSLPDMIEGWKKNTFAYFNYNLSRVIRDSLFAGLFFIWPCIAVFLYSGSLFWLNLANIGLTFIISAYVARQFRLSQCYSLFYPFAIGLLLFSIWNSVLSVYRNQGVIWRGTHYSLRRLREKLPPPASIK